MSREERISVPHQTHLMKIRILGKDHIALAFRKIPDFLVRDTIQRKTPHMVGAGENISDERRNSPGEILIQQELHAWTAMRCSSRSAAKAKQALISWLVSSGKSA
jgi:hypothetical protein